MSGFETGPYVLRNEIKPTDIICGRSKASFNNIGNRRFRVTISINLGRYVNAETMMEKSQIVENVIRVLRDDVGARFLKQVAGKSPDGVRRYVEMDDNYAREKVNNTLRDMALAEAVSQSKPTAKAKPPPPSAGAAEKPAEQRMNQEGEKTPDIDLPPIQLAARKVSQGLQSNIPTRLILLGKKIGTTKTEDNDSNDLDKAISSQAMKVAPLDDLDFDDDESMLDSINPIEIFGVNENLIDDTKPSPQSQSATKTAGNLKDDRR